MCSVVISRRPTDFNKSMATHANHRIWQDVYFAKTANSAVRKTIDLDQGEASLGISLDSSVYRLIRYVSKHCA